MLSSADVVRAVCNIEQAWHAFPNRQIQDVGCFCRWICPRSKQTQALSLTVDRAVDPFSAILKEGVASVVLKTLSQALADGDRIECIIRETGVNQDGRTPGITMPSHKAQEMLIRETYAKAGLNATDPAQRCQYFEAHGKSTKYENALHRMPFY